MTNTPIFLPAGTLAEFDDHGVVRRVEVVAHYRTWRRYPSSQVRLVDSGSLRVVPIADLTAVTSEDS